MTAGRTIAFGGIAALFLAVTFFCHYSEWTAENRGNVPIQSRKLAMKDNPDRAAKFLLALLRRVWISQTLQQPSDMDERFALNFCGDFPQLQKQINEQREKGVRPDELGVWRFKCSPLRLVHVPTVEEIQMGRGLLQYDIANGVESSHYWSEISKIIGTGVLGIYELAPSRAASLMEKLTALSSSGGSVVGGYSILDKSTDNDDYSSIMYGRLMTVLFDKRIVERNHGSDSIRVSLPVEPTFYQ